MSSLQLYQPPSAGPLVELLPGLYARQREAWDHFNRRATPRLYAFCRKRGLHPEDAEDVVQETLLRAFLFLPRFKPDGGAKPLLRWLLGIAYRLIVDLWRRQRPEPLSEALAEGVADPHICDAECGGSPQPNRSRAQDAMAQVRAEFQERTWNAFELVVFGSSTAAQAGAILGMTAKAVRKANARVRARLRELLGA
ncbi:MAG TPA: sigma-70 family RNA polymerase sigma factor [Gemmataceae bacterium]|nr:sigma-70 family RNA polymerase sigma factor [Gemmataceae bacterium]